MLTVYGSGAVGLVVGARLARAGEPVLFVTHGAEQAQRIGRDGVRFEDPGSGESWCTRAEAVAGVAGAGERIGEGPVLFCVRASQTEDCARELALVAPRACPVSLQNDLGNEEILADAFATVIGGVVRQTCTRTAPNAAVALGPGRLVLGAHPQGEHPQVESLARRLSAAGYDVGISGRIAEDLWLKLCVNLMSAPNALIRREDHERRAFVEIKARLLEEAKATLEAAGIAARSCDGRDPSLEQEIERQREGLRRGTSARRLPVYNQVWAALRRGGPLEADRYHRRIIDLAAANGVGTPLNRRVLELLVAAHADGRGPESVAAEAILADA
jgi:2-dehydropantoate 2-reductase